MSLTSIIRRADWRQKLTVYLADAVRTPFSWGEHDCALFVADCVREMTGTDLAAAARGQYRTASEARAFMAAGGVADLTALAASHFEPVAPAFAQVGDIAVVGTKRRMAFGIVVGEMVAVLRRDGLGHISREAAVAAYRVP